jgi:hypothetical protein
MGISGADYKPVAALITGIVGRRLGLLGDRRYALA